MANLSQGISDETFDLHTHLQSMEFHIKITLLKKEMLKMA